MAIFNNPQPTGRKDSAPSFAAENPATPNRDIPTADFAPLQQPPLAARPNPAHAPQPHAQPAAKESLIAADLTIEGKIEGTGHVRIAGRFKGDVNVQGDLTVEQGAKLNGSVRADKVTLAGELGGNIEAAKRVDLLASSAMNGDIKASDLTIASGARLRGHLECGWADAKNASGDKGKNNGNGKSAATASDSEIEAA